MRGPKLPRRNRLAVLLPSPPNLLRTWRKSRLNCRNCWNNNNSRRYYRKRGVESLSITKMKYTTLMRVGRNPNTTSRATWEVWSRNKRVRNLSRTRLFLLLSLPRWLWNRSNHRLRRKSIIKVRMLRKRINSSSKLRSKSTWTMISFSTRRSSRSFPTKSSWRSWWVWFRIRIRTCLYRELWKGSCTTSKSQTA